MMFKKNKSTENMGLCFSEMVRTTNIWILRVQHKVARIYSSRFTFKVSLAFTMIVGSCFAFIGDDCQGKVTFSSPMVYCLFLVAAFFFFQTFIMVPLGIVRAIRMTSVAICGHYLSYQAYGLWSMEYGEGANICKPYTYANITYGYIWLFIPALLIVMVAFLMRDEDGMDFNQKKKLPNRQSGGTSQIKH